MDCGAAADDTVNSMTQEVFNWIARSVNKDFVQLGYPGILTKKGGRDFVSLCALMQNCSALLEIVKARGVFSSSAAAAAAEDGDTATKRSGKASRRDKKSKKSGSRLWFSAAASNASASSASNNKKQQQKNKSFKRLQLESAATQARLAADSSVAAASAATMNFKKSSTSSGNADCAETFQAIAEAVRRDAEEVIESTRCLPESAVAASITGESSNQQSREQQLVVYFATRWPQFKETIARRLLEADQLAVELQSLRAGGLVGGRCWPLDQQQQQQLQQHPSRSKSVSDGVAGGATVEGLHRNSNQSESQKQQQQQRRAGLLGAPDSTSRSKTLFNNSRRRSQSRHLTGGGDINGGISNSVPPLQQPVSNSRTSATRVPALEAEVRRLKLELGRQEQRHKEELSRQARERERLARDFSRAQRRTTGPRWPSGVSTGRFPSSNMRQNASNSHQQQHQYLPAATKTSAAAASAAATTKQQTSTSSRSVGVVSRQPSFDRETSRCVGEDRKQRMRCQLTDMPDVDNSAAACGSCNNNQKEDEGFGGEHRESLISRLTSRIRERHQQRNQYDCGDM